MDDSEKDREHRRRIAKLNWKCANGGSMADHIGIWRDPRYRDAKPEYLSNDEDE